MSDQDKNEAFINALIESTGLSEAAAVDLAGKLSPLAGEHQKLAIKRLDGYSDLGLVDRQTDRIEQIMSDLVRDVPGIIKVSVNHDPRGSTTGLKLATGVYDNWTDGGMLAIPLDFDPATWESAPDAAIDDVYTTVVKDDGSASYEWEEIKDVDERRVWTVVDSDSDELYVLPGFHRVNRVHYLVTEEQWRNDREQYVLFKPDPEPTHSGPGAAL
jgi:hypothetical protein